MASIKKTRNGWQVRWRDPDGAQRKRTHPNRKTAKEHQREVEQTIALGRRWEPRDARPEADVQAILEAYLREVATIHGTGTVRSYAMPLEIFRQWLQQQHPQRRRLPASLLSKELLRAFYADLLRPGAGHHGKTRISTTAKKYLRVVERCWKWAYEDDRYADLVPLPRTLRLPTDPMTPTRAPSWEEMDRAIDACRGWQRVLAVLLRYTGLRVQQCMLLKWADFDLERGMLRIRGELGKSKEEKKGRIIPISDHLVRYLAGLGRREGYVVPDGRKPGPRAREARQRDMCAAWRRAGVDPELWRGQSHHAFRKGFVSELKRAGADVDAVEHLVGHKLPGLRSVYTDPNSLPMREAVELIPAIGQSKVAPLDVQRMRVRAASRAPGAPRRPIMDGGARRLQEVGSELAEAHGNRTRRDPRRGAPIGFEDQAAHQPRARFREHC